MLAEARDWLGRGELEGQRYSLRVPRRARGGGTGSALAPRAGASLEFREHREYEPGDDLRHVDWNVYARSDMLAVRVYHEEIHPHVEILIDGSASMALEGTDKEKASLALPALLASAAHSAGFTCRAWRIAGVITPLDNGTARPLDWQGLEFTHAGETGEAFLHDRPAWRPQSIRILISDLLWQCDPLMILRPLADRASLCVVVQLLAACDANPPAEGNLRLVDCETGLVREILVDESAVRSYREALSRHQQNWHRACRQAGAMFATVIAERLLADWRLEELVASEVLETA